MDGDGGIVTGRLRTLPERGDPVVPGLVGGSGWVALMYARGRMDTHQLAAAVDIGRGLAILLNASASGLRAIDPAALVVDGGNRTSPPLAPVGGIVTSAEAGRVLRWRRGLRASPTMSLLRGRKAALFLDLAVERVITGEVEPRELDARLGLRHGRVQEAVLRELTAYAATLGRVVPKISS